MREILLRRFVGAVFLVLVFAPKKKRFIVWTRGVYGIAFLSDMPGFAVFG